MGQWRLKSIQAYFSPPSMDVGSLSSATPAARSRLVLLCQQWQKIHYRSRLYAGVGGFRVARTRGTMRRTQRFRTQEAVRMRSRERRSTATKDSTRRRAHPTTESDTDFTQVQGPRGEVKPLRPAFLYCTVTPHKAYEVLVTKL
jgi:hypothetical protein